jgi:hypothetical protein
MPHRFMHLPERSARASRSQRRGVACSGSIGASKFLSALAPSISLRGIRPSILALGCLAILGSCATVPPPPPLDRAGGSDALAIVPARYPPDAGFRGHPYGGTVAKGALVGAGAGALGSALLLGIGAAAFPPLGVPLALAAAPVLVGAGAIAGLGGAAAAGPGIAGATVIPDEQRAALVRALNDVLSDAQLSERTAIVVADNVANFAPFRAEVVADAGPKAKGDQPDYRPLRGRGFANVIEMGITSVGLMGWNADRVSLLVTAEARLIDTTTGKPVWLRGLVFESPERSAGQWTRDDAAATRAEIGRASRTLGERIVDVFVLATEPTDTPAFRRWTENCGVEVIEPVPTYALPATSGTRQTVTAPTGSREPLLAWEALPRTSVPLVENPWARAKDARYDLRIWKAVDDVPGDLVYERRDLVGTRHQVDVALDPGTTYFWSVRVRATIDGRPRAAPWSSTSEPIFLSKRFLRDARFERRIEGDQLRSVTCRSDDWIPCGCLDFIPAANFYRFRTP